MKLSEALAGVLSDDTAVRYATVVGVTSSSVQVQMGGEVVDVAYVGDTPIVGRRAVLVAGTAGLLCIGTTTPPEPEWNESQTVVLRPLREWAALRIFAEDLGAPGAVWEECTPHNWQWIPYYLGLISLRELTGDEEWGHDLWEEAFAVQYAPLAEAIPAGAELLGVSLRLYSTHVWFTWNGGYSREPINSRTATVSIAGADLTPFQVLPEGRADPFPILAGFEPFEAVTLGPDKAGLVQLPDTWADAFLADPERRPSFAFSTTNFLIVGDLVGTPHPETYEYAHTTNDNLDLIITYRTPYEPDSI